MLRVAFGYLAAVCDQEKQIRDMTRRARNYFAKRRHFKSVYSVFHALREYSQMKLHTRVSGVDLEL
jgi:hypothetical protein